MGKDMFEGLSRAWWSDNQDWKLREAAEQALARMKALERKYERVRDVVEERTLCGVRRRYVERKGMKEGVTGGLMVAAKRRRGRLRKDGK